VFVGSFPPPPNKPLKLTAAGFCRTNGDAQHAAS